MGCTKVEILVKIVPASATIEAVVQNLSFLASCQRKLRCSEAFELAVTLHLVQASFTIKCFFVTDTTTG